MTAERAEVKFDGKSFARWRANPILFIQEVLVDPETDRPFVLNAAQIAFLAAAFEPDANGRLKYPEMVFGAIKKSGKTALAAMIVITMLLLFGGRFAEGLVIANDFEQAQGRVFTAAARIVEASPLLRRGAKVLSDRIIFSQTGATIWAIGSDYASAAGAEPTITALDELWGVKSERGRRLFDEVVPPPTRKIACRLTVSYAGFSGESELLEELYKRGMALPEIGPSLRAGDGMLMAWHHEPIAPWQTQAWLDEMRRSLRPNQYLRLCENRWVSTELSFVDLDWFDACVDPELSPIWSDKTLPIFVGVDASVKHDSTAVVACAFNTKTNRVRVVAHRIFQPSASEPLNFEVAVENTIKDMRARFFLRGVFYDPYQMASTAQRLAQFGIPMREYPQSVPNLTAMGSNLFELIKGCGITFYEDDAIRLAISRTIALETPRGMRLAKEKSSYKIDVIVALAMAALGAVQEGQYVPMTISTRGRRRSDRSLRAGEVFLLTRQRRKEGTVIDRKTLSRELRKKFKSPQAAMRALGLDSRLLLPSAHHGMAFDAARDERGLTATEVAELERLCAESMEPAALKKLTEFLERKMSGETEGESFDAEPIRQFLNGKMSQDDVETLMGLMPKNGTEGGQGGRTGQQTDPIGAMDRRRKQPVLAMDARAEKEMFAMFPQMRRIGFSWDGNVDRRDNN